MVFIKSRTTLRQVFHSSPSRTSRTGTLIFDECKFISQEDHEKFTKRCRPKYLDILYTKVSATYGRPALIETDKEFSIYVSVCLIKPNKAIIDPRFLAEALRTPALKREADRSIKGIGVPDLHLDQIQNSFCRFRRCRCKRSLLSG
jgi:type I restriction enzyme S subunit